MDNSFDSLLNASAVPQDEKVQAFIAESRNNRNRCYESVSYTHLVKHIIKVEVYKNVSKSKC